MGENRDMKKKSELNKELYTPAEVAKELGITTRTLFTWADMPVEVFH